MTSVTPALASDVAKYFIWKSGEMGWPITNKKLQKLIYYSQAWYLVSTKGSKKLFEDDIEAWIHGPVVPAIYHQYKHFGFNPISPALGSNVDFPQNISELLKEVWDTYGELDGDTLESLTHSEMPWREARKGVDDNTVSSNIIDPNLMTDYYTELKKKLEAKAVEIPILSALQSA